MGGKHSNAAEKARKEGHNSRIRIKIVVIGNEAAGKSRFVTQFTGRKYFELKTIGVDITRRTINIDDEQDVVIEIWDTGGDPRFLASLPRTTFYRGADGFIIVYDVTNQASWESVPKYIQELKEHLLNRYGDRGNMTTDRILLVGTKCDMENERCVQYLDARKLADSEFKVPLIEVSGVDGTNVELAFATLATPLVNKIREIRERV